MSRHRGIMPRHEGIALRHRGMMPRHKGIVLRHWEMMTILL